MRKAGHGCDRGVRTEEYLSLEEGPLHQGPRDSATLQQVNTVLRSGFSSQDEGVQELCVFHEGQCAAHC